MSILRTVWSVVLVSVVAAGAAEPVRDVRYDEKHARNVLDFWPALEADGPAPVFVWFHGGGFRNGDKSQLEKRRGATIDLYRDAGYAVVSCNYPFLSEDMDYRQIVEHCARAVQFVRSKSGEWNLNPEQLCCGGVSAGALISQFLGYHDDFANPGAEDAVARQSSRAAVVCGVMQPIGTDEFALRYMDKGEAPIFLYSNASPSDRIHPPAMVKKLQAKAKALGIPCVAHGGGRNSLPPVATGRKWLELQLEFCDKHLGR